MSRGFDPSGEGWGVMKVLWSQVKQLLFCWGFMLESCMCSWRWRGGERVNSWCFCAGAWIEDDWKSGSSTFRELAGLQGQQNHPVLGGRRQLCTSADVCSSAYLSKCMREGGTPWQISYGKENHLSIQGSKTYWDNSFPFRFGLSLHEAVEDHLARTDLRMKTKSFSNKV